MLASRPSPHGHAALPGAPATRHAADRSVQGTSVSTGVLLLYGLPPANSKHEGGLGKRVRSEQFDGNVRDAVAIHVPINKSISVAVGVA